MVKSLKKNWFAKHKCTHDIQQKRVQHEKSVKLIKLTELADVPCSAPPDWPPAFHSATSDLPTCRPRPPVLSCSQSVRPDTAVFLPLGTGLCSVTPGIHRQKHSSQLSMVYPQQSYVDGYKYWNINQQRVKYYLFIHSRTHCQYQWMYKVNQPQQHNCQISGLNFQKLQQYCTKQTMP